MGLSSRPWKIRFYRSIEMRERKWKLEWMRAISSITHQRQTGDCLIIVIEKLHQIKKKGHSENPRKPRTILCWFLNYKDKANILKNVKKLKGKNICFNENFSHETMELHKELCEKVKNIGRKVDILPLIQNCCCRAKK